MNNLIPTVSVVIPAFNEQHHIRRCIEALERQSVAPKQIIVVDNNSADDTAQIVAEYKSVTLLYESHQGVRYARNKGFNAVDADIIARIDADTVVTDEWVERLVNFFQDNEDIVGVVGASYYYDLPLAKNKKNVSIDRFLRRLIRADKRPLLYGSNMALRKSAWSKIRNELCMDGEMFEDYDISIHLAEHDLKVGYEPTLVAGISARRLADRPHNFWRNMLLHTKTFRMHGQRNLVARLSQIGYLFAYPLFALLYRYYDSQEQRLHLTKKSRRHKSARPDSSYY